MGTGGGGGKVRLGQALGRSGRFGPLRGGVPRSARTDERPPPGGARGGGTEPRESQEEDCRKVGMGMLTVRGGGKVTEWAYEKRYNEHSWGSCVGSRRKRTRTKDAGEEWGGEKGYSIHPSASEQPVPI
eukprot:7799456-Pyramimonas_sp.AAC.1